MLESKKCLSSQWCSINNTELCSRKLPQSRAGLYPTGALMLGLNEANVPFENSSSPCHKDFLVVVLF